ncbi:5640_t:CDS:2 [Diversispora eburnea]|uniref:Proteasome subunit beta n=1 Tax=Diversispora eburnea TaxID=1213867 RepID=A0A9N8Z4X1_9GLOM|nr:5640_t:CDS:2 [Diversispora eburnea]
MDLFVNQFKDSYYADDVENLFNDEFDASKEFSLPILELPACENPVEFMKAHDFKFDHGTTTLAFKFHGGVVVCVDSRASSGSYIATHSVKKVIEINPYLLGTMAGGAADCMFWERELAAASKLLANIVYRYKGYGLSMGTMVTGWDKTVNSDGSRLKGDLFSVGSGSLFAYGVLDNGFDYDMSVQDALELGRRSVYHAAHRDSASGGTLNLYHVKESGWDFIGGYDFDDLHWEYQDQPKPRITENVQPMLNIQA